MFDDHVPLHLDRFEGLFGLWVEGTIHLVDGRWTGVLLIFDCEVPFAVFAVLTKLLNVVGV